MHRTALLSVPLAAAFSAVACYEHSPGHDRPGVVCAPPEEDDGEPGGSPSSDDPTDCPSGVDALYLSDDPLTCTAIDFECPDDHERFDSECGCGCVPVAPADVGTSSTCPDADQPDVFYLGTDDKVCDGIEFTCPTGQERFDSPCGCGCRSICPDPEDDQVHYLSDDPALCDLITFTCPTDCEPFDDRCGCGCIEPEAGAGCPDPDDPNVLYVSTSTAVCSRVELSCPDGEQAFDDACGCGCLR